jgi:type II secretory pathway component GspD/PulD (secretin)
MDRLVARRFVTLALALLLTSSDLVFAQYDGGNFGGGYGRGGRERRRFRGGMDRPNLTAPPVVNPNAEKPKEEKKDDKPAEPKKEEGPKPITRPPAPYDNSASLAEQQMTVDSKRMVSFNFQEAPWTFVVEELARVSGATLDWTQLPGDSFNLRSNKKYTAAEARDLVNEHLLARGYAILFDSKTNQMKVVSLDDVNTALVPRVAPEDLDNLPPHDLVKVTFRLEWLLANKDTVDEFKQVLSPKAKLLALKTSNRLEAIDSVINLRQLAALLDEEQGRGGLNRLAQEFELRYTRAPEVVDQLELFLGLKKPGENGMQNVSPMQQMMMQRMQMMAGQQGQQPGQQSAGMQAPPEIHLMANTRRNTVIVNAPPDKMGIIKSAIWKIDVPSDRPSLSDNTHLMQPYRLTTVDPDVVVSFLETVADLDPQTKLDIDKKTHTVIAYASAKDQKVIAALVKNLDSAERQLKVIQLRRLDADLVAGTIRMLMVGPDDKNSNNNNNNGYGGRRFGFWSALNSSNNNEEQSTSKFRVEADIVDNRLMVFANTTELDQVYKCLAEMGEVPKRERGVDTMRVLDLGAGDEQKVLLERLRKVWPTLGKDGNKLIIDVPEKKTAPAQDDSKPEQSAPKAAAPSTVPSASDKNQKPPNQPVGKSERSASQMPVSRIQFVDLKQVVAPADRTVADAASTNGKASNSVSAPAAASETAPAPLNVRHGRKGRRNRLQQVQAQPAEDMPSADKAAQPEQKSIQGAPIYITRGEDGKLVISSRDTEALDQLEEMAGRLAPRRKDYAVFYLKHADAYGVQANLEIFFQTEKKDSSEDKFRRWWWDDDSSNKKDDSPMLSRRKPMRFIVDGQTNSILVQGGTADQLRQIKELIDMYDSPPPVSVRPARQTKLFHIKHSKASVIAEVIKDAYRDLLSTKDKALESYNQTKAQGRAGGRGYISYDFGEKEDDGKMSQARFSGALSLGVDDTTNTLLVSCATQNMLLNITQIIENLDESAVQAAQSFQVLQINRSIDVNALQKKLTDMLKKTVGSPETTQQPNPAQQNQGQRRGRGGRNGNRNGGGGNESTND